MGPYQILVLTIISITAAKVHVHVFHVFQFFVQHKVHKHKYVFKNINQKQCR